MLTLGLLFGVFTAQPPAPPEVRNGFLALAEFDKSQQGGNSDAVISSQDAVFDLFKYRAKAWDAQGAEVGRRAWDVFLVQAQ